MARNRNAAGGMSGQTRCTGFGFRRASRTAAVISLALCMLACGGEEDVRSSLSLATVPASQVTDPAAGTTIDATAAAAGATKKVAQASIRDYVGVQVQPWYVQQGDLARIQSTGFGVVRWGVSWQQVEQSPGIFDWSEVDRFVVQLRQTTLRSVVILGFGNALYSGSVVLNPDPAARDTTSPAPPETPAARAAFVRFATEAAKRYADLPITWEIWNEPDSSVFWPLAPNFAAYASLANDTCRSIKASVPGVGVVGAVGAALPNAVMLQPGNLYSSVVASQAVACFDAISAHGYRMDDNYNSPDPDSVARDLSETNAYLYDVLQIPKSKKFFMTEWGFPTSKVSPDLQVAYLMRGTLTNLAHNVGLTVWYEWRNSRLEQANHEAHFGMLEMYGAAKASPEAMAKLAWLAGSTFVGPLETGRDDVGAALVSSGAKQYAVAWLRTDDQNRRLRAYVNGAFAAEISFLPQALPAGAGRLTLSFQD